MNIGELDPNQNPGDISEDNPSKILEKFEQNHISFIATIRVGHEHPSEEAIRLVNKAAEVSTQPLQNFYENKFFGVTGNDIAVRASVMQIVRSTEELIGQANYLMPGSSSIVINDQCIDEIIDILLSCSDSDYDTEADLAGEAAGNICESYNIAVDNLVDVFEATPIIEKIQQLPEKRKQLKKNVIDIGKLALGIFIGIKLAQVSLKTSKK
ncbi:MAG: hypothetical protein WCP03_03625 [Candidatus Saccharibacteria bacterium]